MEKENSLELYHEKNVLAKISHLFAKVLTPTKIGINGFIISRKRNALLKAYENYIEVLEDGDEKIKEQVEDKYENSFSTYLETIDKHIMDNVYKKVRNNIATEFEKIALSKYYTIVHLKEDEYQEYKYKKQIFLIELDHETIKEMKKEKLLAKYENFYADRMEGLYKKLLKNYSIKISGTSQGREKAETFDKIFRTVEEYIVNILPLKMLKESDNKIYKEILEDYHSFEKFEVGKLDQNDYIEKDKILLGISRKLFVHSIPLAVAEECYEKLIDDARFLIMDTKMDLKKEKAYGLLMNLIEDYNARLLSTKIYWEKPQEKEKFKKFWEEFQKIEELKNEDNIEYSKQREILFLRKELNFAYKNENRYYRILSFYKSKLVEYGVMTTLKENAKSIDKKYFSKEGIVLGNRLAKAVGE